MRNARAGLTLIEVIVAMLLFTIGALGMAASSAAITRQMTLSLLRSRAATVARVRDEKAHAVACAGISSGSATEQGITSTWTVVQGVTASIEQSIERRGVVTAKTDHFLSSVPCT